MKIINLSVSASKCPNSIWHMHLHVLNDDLKFFTKIIGIMKYYLIFIVNVGADMV